MKTVPTILWTSLDGPGHESARIVRDGSLWLLAGTAVFAEDGQPCRLDYRVVCDADWRSLSGHVDGWVGGRTVEIEVVADSGRWQLNGEEQPQVEGCTDFDLNFSPSTNLLPIRRLNLEVGQEAGVKAAWLRFPSFRLELLEQVYRRTAPSVYRFVSNGGTFTRDLEVNEAGLVTVYPGLWEAVAP